MVTIQHPVIKDRQEHFRPLQTNFMGMAVVDY